MKDYYIYPAEAHRKLKLARGLSQTVYIGAPVGFGKTELVHQYLKARNYVEISAKNGRWNTQELEDRLAEAEKKSRSSEAVLVVDDLQFLESDECKLQLHKISQDENIWMILIGRAMEVKWLAPVFVEYGYVRITEKDLAFTLEDTDQYLDACGITISKKNIKDIHQRTLGNPKAIKLIVRFLHENGTDNPNMKELFQETDKLFQDYFIMEITRNWDRELTEFLMQVSVIDSFDCELAEMITGNSRAAGILARAENTGSFMEKEGDRYRLRHELLKALQKLRNETLEASYVRELYYNAGLYYETHDKVMAALDMYTKSGSKKRMEELLIRNARKNPCNGDYYDLREYYLELPEEEIDKSSVLLAGMSMLYSLSMEPEKSEYWYQKLVYHKEMSFGSEKREAESRLAYLDLALPHRGTKNLEEILHKLPKQVQKDGLRLPEFSVTSNLPSLINGGKDFCQWTLHDREIVSSMGQDILSCVGDYGKGLLNLALGESSYERGEDSFEVIRSLSKAQMEAQLGGRKEIEFAILGVMTRLNILHGKEDDARVQLDRFQKTLTSQTPRQLARNLQALKARIALHDGNLKMVEDWMSAAPDETEEFNLLDRYQYMTKIRCYIALGDTIKAYSLLEKMMIYAKRYGRVYLYMEVELLKAILNSQRGVDYLLELEEALTLAQRYHFVRLISAEGAAVRRLLQVYAKWEKRKLSVENAWFRQIIREADRMENQYPTYLRGNTVERSDLSSQALSVLSLMAKGYSIPQIAENLSMKTNTVKYHTKQIYRKLGAARRSEAVLIARNMGIL